MNNHLIVIDDTGSPGSSQETRFLKENRKTLVAVFIHSKIRVGVENTLKEIVSSLKKEFGVSEIHLTDIVNKKNEYSKISDEDRSVLIECLSKWFSNIKLPYFVQTANESTFKENNIQLSGKLGNFDLKKGEDQALLLLIAKIKEFMANNFQNEKVEIVMDEGRKKNNQIEHFNGFEDFLQDNAIKYYSSKEFVLLQIADFFAYSMNRTQMTIIKEMKTDFDKQIYKYLNAVLVKQYSEGTLIINADYDTFTKDDYDYSQREQRQVDGNLDSWRDSQNK